MSFSELLLKFAKYCSDSSWQGFNTAYLNWNWAGAPLFILTELVIPPPKSPCTLAFLQHRLAAPGEPAPSELSDMTRINFLLLSLGLPFSPPAHSCTHRHTHTFWAFTLSRKGKETAQNGLSRRSSDRDMRPFFSSVELAAI